MTNSIQPKRTNLYPKIVGFFLVLTIGAIFVVLHFALAKVTISLENQSQEKSNSVLVELKSEESDELSPDIILGKIIETEFEAEASIDSQKENVPSKYAAGYVTIYNNYSQNQTLVKTTRLLTPDNKLFRISERVEVPAGSSMEVWAQADEEGEKFVTGATTFTIPGLWEGLQDKIYAETKAGMLLQSTPQYAVSQADLDQLQTDIKAKVEVEALEKINALVPETLAIKPEQLSLKFENISSSQVGDNSPKASLKQKILAYGLIFNQEDLLKIAQEKFKKQLEGNTDSLTKFNDTPLSYKILEMDLENDTAVLEVNLSATVSSQASEMNVSKEKIVGLDENGIGEYLKSLGIDNFEIKFFPAWIKKAPKFTDHIIIE